MNQVLEEPFTFHILGDHNKLEDEWFLDYKKIEMKDIPSRENNLSRNGILLQEIFQVYERSLVSYQQIIEK